MSKEYPTREEMMSEEARYNLLKTRRDRVGKVLHGADWRSGHDYDEHEETLLALAELLPSPDDIIIRKDGDMYMAVKGDFVNLQESESYWSDTPMIALSNLLAQDQSNKVDKE